VMPLASPIGSGRGILTRANLEIIVEEARVPVVVDAGLGVPSEAAAVMEMGADAVLVNTAIAEARDPVRMAAAFARAVEAGRDGYLAGRMPVRAHASPSSPTAGVVRLPDPEVPA
jgi:thiazole synthase